MLLKEYITTNEKERIFLLDEVVKKGVEFLKDILDEDIKDMSKFIFIDGNSIITYEELKNFYYLKQYDFYSIKKDLFYNEEMLFYHHFKYSKSNEIDTESKKYKELLKLEYGECGERMFQYFAKEWNNNSLIMKYN